MDGVIAFDSSGVISSRIDEFSIINSFKINRSNTNMPINITNPNNQITAPPETDLTN